MREFDKSTIDEWRAKFAQRAYLRRTADIDDRSIDYFVMPASLFRGPGGALIPNGLFRLTGQPQDGYVVGVSEEVPELIQPYFAVSEHDEFMVYGLADEERTLHSEQHMVDAIIADARLRAQYVASKLLLYEHMLRHAATDLEAWGFTQADYQGFRSARDFLQRRSS